ncbi:hydrolase [Niastella yeongjuensis]|uniref:Hydrolase n=1 Tax=Niastella yeongjuensis TaxID=354355 RepID=A0A1V9EPS8_9BACT|nr:isochorismatase family protein [Niastella yeongjuensis]OQP48091.1 hydrolase [Niastella yeongjuensis]SEO26365.1 Nicotinamidase-related amidase [Niastella yeongjuensis]
MKQNKLEAIPSKRLLVPGDSVLLLIDHQPQMAFATKSIAAELLINNVVGLAKAAKVFAVPTILTTVATTTFSGPLFPALQAVYPEQKPIDRSTLNSWEDQRVVDEVMKYNRPKLIVAGLWTEVCLVTAVLSALEQGLDVFFVTDASGGVSEEAHTMAVERMIMAGAQPVTWLQFMLELQRDWARKETYDAVTAVVKEHAGTYGIGVQYVKSMLSSNAGEG